MTMNTLAKAGCTALIGLVVGCFNPAGDPLAKPVMLAAETGGETDGPVGDQSSGSEGSEADDDTGADSGGPEVSTDSGSTDREDQEAWEEFQVAREGYLVGLAEPILECIEADGEAQFPLFNRCKNWHGYVHANYALHALYRMTGDESYRERADAMLPAEGLAAEIEMYPSGQTALFEAYARGWLLALAMERERATGANDLGPLATKVAAQARAWVNSLTWPEIQDGVLSGGWDNLPWVVLNLWQWGNHIGDESLTAEMETFATDVLLSPSFDAHCSFLEDNDVVDGFFAPCLHRFMVAGAILPESELTAWLESALAENFDPVPLAEVEMPFHGGLNFSRAWGLWQIYRITGDTSWRTRYVEHIARHMMMPQFWNDPDNEYGFWVPQFGVYAIALSEGEG